MTEVWSLTCEIFFLLFSFSFAPLLSRYFFFILFFIPPPHLSVGDLRLVEQRSGLVFALMVVALPVNREERAEWWRRTKRRLHKRRDGESGEECD